MKKKFNYENITGLHLELTTKCNAMCPMCNRNFKGKVRNKLPILELSIDDIKSILLPEFVKKLELISLCGVYGDPICNSNLKEIISYLYKCNNNVEIDIYTNGSLYDEKWWEDLADLMHGYKGSVIFGIDGIGDIHSFHRQNTDYNKVIMNAKAFISKGGFAQWDYIVFRHNEHLVEDARKISKELGFKIFQIKKSGRFLKRLYESDKNLDSTILDYGKHPIYNENGEIVDYLELSCNSEYRNKSEVEFLRAFNEYSDFIIYLDNVEIECDSIVNGGIFISASGEVFPCCTVYQQICYKTVHEVCDKGELNEYNLYLADNLSCFDRSIEDIVNGKFFNSLYKCFECSSIELGKPKSCSRTCGKNLNIHTNSHTTEIKYMKDGK